MNFFFIKYEKQKVSLFNKFIIISIFLYICSKLYLNKTFFDKLKKIIMIAVSYFKKCDSMAALIENNNIIKNLENPIYKKAIFKKGKKFITKCMSKINQKYKIDVKPIISSIIPVYNCEKSIRAAINSIQFQNFSDFEIILINDFSNDMTSQIIKNLQENDSRIKIVNNKKNMGSLYSRSIGVLISNGKYIFPLDNDDMFFCEDIFYSIIKIAQESNLDIVGFRAIRMKNFKDKVTQMKDYLNYNHHDNLIIGQPYLSRWFITLNGNFKIHDVTVWCKCIKTKIYKEATNMLGADRYTKFVSWAEDTSINIIIFNVAQSFLFFNKYGIAHLVSTSTASYTQPDKIKFFGLLFLLDILFDFSKNKNKFYAVNFSYIIKNQFNVKRFINDNNIIFFRNIIRKISRSKYISSKLRYKIRRDFIFFFS